MSHKAIFVSSNNFINDTASGGKKCSKRNFELFRHVYGKEESLLYVVSNDFERDSVSVWEDSEVYYIAGCSSQLKSFMNYSHGYNVMTPRAEREFIRLVAKEKPDCIFFDSSIFGRTIQRMKQIYPQIKTVCFMHNIEKWYGWSRVLHENPLYITYYYASYYNEKRALKYADRVISLTERDQENTEKIYHRRTDMMLPITFRDVYKRKGVLCQDTPYFLFVGSLFQPNIEGLEWLVDNVMKQVPYQLKIVGKGLETLKDRLTRDNIEVVGGVEDLAPYYEAASAVILPIFYGNGMKVKTAEAMMYGKNIIATDEALVGYEIDGVVGIYRCNTAQEFLQAMHSTYSAKESCFNNQVRELFLNKYETGNYVEKMKKMILE